MSDGRELLLPIAGVGEGQCGQAGGFGCGYAEQAQDGLGELIDSGLVHTFGVALAQPQQAEQPPGHGAERDPGLGDSEAARRPGPP